MSPVIRFLLGSVAAMLVVVVGMFFAMRSVTIKEAERDTRVRVQLEGGLVESAGLTTACCVAIQGAAEARRPRPGSGDDRHDRAREVVVARWDDPL
ncbi:MAG TPA: hypothetical protein VJU79_02095 [Candidatus Dormibacteraeota bacterium]|nr:hypothetical protein [Candidatus Dormibacteraeota bacterium]